MRESKLIQLESQMRTRHLESLPAEQLTELLLAAQAILPALTGANKERATTVIQHIRSLIQARHLDQKHRELQEKLSGMHAVLDRSERLATRFEQQMEKLLTVANRQKVLAEKLDRQTTHLIRLTYVVGVLTIALFVVTFKEMAESHEAAVERRQGEAATNK